jgi:drug/metabolite transporter (DMT)-like permease
MINTKLAYRYAFLAVFLWSTVASAFKLTLNYINPVELVFYSSISSTICIYYILIYLKQTHYIFNYIRNNIYKVLLLGFLNPFLYYLILFKAYDLLPAQEAQAINYTWALMLAFLSVPILKQKLTQKDIIAGIICYFGVLVIATKGDILGFNFTNLLGVFYALFSTVVWALYWLFNIKNTSQPVVALFSNFLIGLPLIAIYYFLKNDISTPHVYGILGSIYIGFFEMGITFVLWTNAMNYAKNTASISNIIFLSPFLSLFFISLFLGEEIIVSTIIGLIMIIFGLLFQQY